MIASTVTDRVGPNSLLANELGKLDPVHNIISITIE